MKNKKFIILQFLFLNLIFFNAFALDQFNFEITEIEITENGNLYKGKKRGEIVSNDGITIKANNFEYIKDLNILKANGNVEIFDTTNNIEIYTSSITYNKNENKIFTKIKSKAINKNNGLIIDAKEFQYNRNKNKIIAKYEVEIIDNINDIKINSDLITYFKDEEKFFSTGKTSALIYSKYNFESEDTKFLRNSMELTSNKNSKITDKSNLYNLGKFKYLIEKEELFGENIVIATDYKLPKSDKFYFSSAIINLKDQNFVAKDTKIKINKEIFGNPENDPVLVGISSNKKGEITVLNKGKFTSCNKKEPCPPWIIQADKIVHDKNKKQLNYKNAILKIYNIPVLYFPKFFHPDPTVKRQSGFLQPRINDSSILGTSFSIPYYKVIDQNRDFTFTPTLFDTDMEMMENEYRHFNEDFKFETNFGYINNYESSVSNKKKDIKFLFSKFEMDLKWSHFTKSNLFFNFEKTTNDTFLKVFDSNLSSDSVKPKNYDILTNELKIELDNENYDFTAGLIAYENLQEINSDRYQYILPYYNFNKNISDNFFNGTVAFNSSGSNDLNNTNNLRSLNINDISYFGKDIITSKGFKNNFNFYFKNLNSVGKKDVEYKSTPQIELMSISELVTSLPLIKNSEKYNNYLTPKLSLKFNPSDMKNYSDTNRPIRVDNIFNLNRLGLNDSFESGKSLTLGLNYKKEKLSDINKYFEIKLATVLRNDKENFIPKTSTLNKKNSHLFGSLKNNFSDFFNIEYEFALDNDYKNFDRNSINTTFILDNFVSTFNFIKEDGEIGDSNVIENTTKFKLNSNNSLSFGTRKNRKINLTEYYDLVYEYKNDCLTAGIKYKKTYYEDRDLKPTEDLLFTITLFPLTTYEQKIDR